MFFLNKNFIKRSKEYKSQSVLIKRDNKKNIIV
jgi:hypothetical protein